MRYIIAAATAITLIVGIAIGFALTDTVFEAEAKPPPEVQPVVEQNVDASGFIAVHEQGVVDVDVVSVPAQPPPEGRLILVAENVNLGPGGQHTTGFFSTADCRRLTVFTEGSGGGDLQIRLILSADGVTANVTTSIAGIGPSNAVNNVVFFAVAERGPFVTPHAAVGLVELGGVNPVTIDKASLFCSR